MSSYIYAIIRGDQCLGRWEIKDSKVPLEDFFNFLAASEFPGEPHDEIYVRVAHRPEAFESEPIGEPQGNA